MLPLLVFWVATTFSVRRHNVPTVKSQGRSPPVLLGSCLDGFLGTGPPPHTLSSTAAHKRLNYSSSARRSQLVFYYLSSSALSQCCVSEIPVSPFPLSSQSIRETGCSFSEDIFMLLSLAGRQEPHLGCVGKAKPG